MESKIIRFFRRRLFSSENGLKSLMMSILLTITNYLQKFQVLVFFEKLAQSMMSNLVLYLMLNHYPPSP